MKKLITILLLAFAVGCTGGEKVPDANKMADQANEQADAEKEKAEAEAQAQAEAEAEEAMKVDVFDTLVKEGNFTTLVAALTAAELTETLKQPGPYTLFAPTDEAFAKLPANTVEEWLKPENKDKLKAVLQFHVVPGEVRAADVQAGEVETLNETAKAQVEVAEEEGTVTYAGANVTRTDIEARNGVVHVIDTVVLPPEADATAQK